MADYRLRFHPAAVNDAEAAHAWYASRSLIAADQFIENLDIALGRVLESPARWPRIVGGRRRFILAKFPFSVVYRIVGDEIEVLAVAHHRRRPHYWTSRH